MFLKTKANLIGKGPVNVEFSWTPAEPFAVTMNVEDGDVLQKWLFAVDLLRNGGGEGDVHIIKYAYGPIRISLDSPDGHAEFGFPWATGLSDWIDKIPADNDDFEIMDWEIINLLGPVD